jgi:hypothetical protein
MLFAQKFLALIGKKRSPPVVRHETSNQSRVCKTRRAERAKFSDREAVEIFTPELWSRLVLH